MKFHDISRPIHTGMPVWPGDTPAEFVFAATKAGDYFRSVYDLMVLAFQTDVTRVATFSLGGEGDAAPDARLQRVRSALAGRAALGGSRADEFTATIES